MTEARIGVIGLPGSWSSEALADEVEKKTGRRLLADMSDAVFDTADRCVMCTRCTRFADEIAEIPGFLRTVVNFGEARFYLFIPSSASFSL